jgi:hypothetical protein
MPSLVPTSPPYAPLSPFPRRGPLGPRFPGREPLLLEWLCTPRQQEWGDPGQPSEGGVLPDEGRRRRDPGEEGAGSDDEPVDDDETVS